MNPWKATLGCEVNVCSAKECDPDRMKICALRKAYLERVAKLRLMYARARSAGVRKLIEKKLTRLEAKCHADQNETNA